MRIFCFLSSVGGRNIRHQNGISSSIPSSGLKALSGIGGISGCGARGIPFWELTWESPVCLTLRAVGRDLPRLRQAAEDAGGSLHLCRSGGVPVFWRRLRRRCRPLPWERSSHSVSGRLVWQSRPVRVFSFPSRRPPT